MSETSELAATQVAETSSTAARDIRKALRRADDGALRAAVLRHWKKPRRRLHKLTGRKDCLSLWSVDDIDLNGRERELASAVELLFPARHPDSPSRPPRTEPFRDGLEALLSAWLHDVNGSFGNWELLTVAELLLRFGEMVSDELFVRCLKVLELQCGQRTSGREAKPPSADSAELGLENALELESDILLSMLLEPLGTTSGHRKAGCRRIREAVSSVLGSKGIVQHEWLGRLESWLAVMTRCLIWGEIWQEKLLNRPAYDRWTRGLRRAAAMLTADGIIPLQQRDVPASPVRPLLVLSVAFRLAEADMPGEFRTLLTECRRLSRSRRAVPRPAAVMLRRAPVKRDLPAWQSDESQVAIMRTSLRPFADLGIVAWGGPNVDVALVTAGLALIDGEWSWSATINGEAVAPPAEWRASCWYRDREIMLLELSSADGGPATIVRQIALGVTEQFAVFTDSITAADPNADVRLDTSLVGHTGLRSETDVVSPELLLTAHPARRTRAIPGWMEDDRLRHSQGAFSCEEATLRMSATGRGGLVVPLVLDWNDKRGNALADWNRLTVCEDGRVSAGNEAGAFRIRAGSLQLMIYRSLRRPQVARTVLGMHTHEETIYARIDSGKIPASMVAIEAGDALPG